MSIEITFDFDGSSDLTAMLVQRGAKAERNAYKTMVTQAEEIAALARRMAPVDEGDLEKAIEVEEIKGGRNALGQFAKSMVAIWVNPDIMTKGGLTGDYAYLMHEHLSYGSLDLGYNLGEKSRAKQAADPTVLVGGKYLERAIEDRGSDVYGLMAAAILDAF